VGIFVITQNTHAVEEINRFDTRITMNQDATLFVEETITYNFGSEQKHGIFRMIPVRYSTDSGTREISLSDIFVGNTLDTPYTYDVSDEGAYTQIKIGDPNVFVSGVQTYQISYIVTGAINYFEDHDELYWNVTGNEWEIPVGESYATVLLPSRLGPEQVSFTCFAGPSESSTPCTSSRIRTGENGVVESVQFEQKLLSPQTGFTVVVGIPKNILPKVILSDNTSQSFSTDLAESPFFVAIVIVIVSWPIFLFLFLFRRWWKYGRDPKGRETIITQFDAPDKLSALEVGILIDETAHNKDITAEIVQLAIRGYIKINRIEEKGLFRKNVDYELIKLKEYDEKLSLIDEKLLEGLFGRKKTVLLSDLKEKFIKTVKEIREDANKDLADKKYFQKSPAKVKNIYFTVGAVMIIAGVPLGSMAGFIGVIGFIVSGIMIILFGRIMPARTKEGVLAREHILGLKNYLEVAEKDRIAFHNAPEKNPQLFEKLLPYAMVLGVESQWAKQFEGIYTQQPNWYSAPSGSAFNSMLLLSSLHSFNSTAQSTLYASPRSAAGGGSGFSGGHSGGGFGGGGGGSW